jgi:hypothetical protein
MPKDAKDVGAGLTKKGFQARENDHTFYHLYVEGKKTGVYTKISHGEKEIRDGLLGAMARQVKLTRKQFNDLIDCPLTADEYVKLMRKAGAVETPKEEPK